MPSQVYEEALELEIGLLEALEPTPGSYPYPALQVTGRAESRVFQSIVLENAYLRATFIPALGGRLLSLFDKRSAAEKLHTGPLISASGGRRGAYVEAGTEVQISGERRVTSLGAVLAAAIEPEDDEAPAALWLSEASCGGGLSWHLRIELPANAAQLRLQGRVFNRTFSSVPYNGGLIAPGFSPIGAAAVKGGLVIESKLSAVGGALCRFPSAVSLAPRQTDAWEAAIGVFGLDAPDGASAEVALAVGASTLALHSSRARPRHKLFLLTGGGQTVETTVDLVPEQVLEVPLGELRPEAIVLRDADGVDVLRWPVEVPAIEPAPSSREVQAADSDYGAFDPSTRHGALVLRAMNDHGAAESHLEQALMYDAEDHLAWWLKAALSRGEEDSPELLNAHFLAPLEPALRAESFLRQPREQGREPNPLLKPLAQTPDAFIEVAALLIEANLVEDAARWIDEALRHEDMAMLRYLLASAYLMASRMEVDAAQQVAAAAKLGVRPPYPYRDVEWTALRSLHERFPADATLTGYLDLATKFDAQ